MRQLSIDLETFSSVDLKNYGMHKYIDSPDFEVMLFGYAFDSDPVKVVDLVSGETIPAEVIEALTDPEVLKTAYNAGFERNCLRKHIGREMPAPQWSCTMAMGLYNGLPGGLDAMSRAMRLTLEKDVSGKGLINMFCKPVKPTKTNGFKTRYGPKDKPEDWARFIEYCAQDVRVERQARRYLRPLPFWEQQLWALDQDMNDKGVSVDTVLVGEAVRCFDAYELRLLREARILTGLSNPNSVAQLKAWLEAEMELEDEEDKIASLNKATVADLLETTDDFVVRRMLEIRQELGKSSCKKFHKLLGATCSDGRIRGILQYYGANRTGRWAGRLLQVQNLPRNYLSDLDAARRFIRAGKHQEAEALWDNIPDLLSQLIRTALVAEPGKVLLINDFSAIEARVIAWLADETWRMEVFRTHGKIYEASAAAMFGIPIEQVTKGSDWRQKGKVAELGCIAEGALVLTSAGLVPIEEINSNHLVWDGVEWVKTEGTLFRGIKEVITYDGLTATPDHRVWVEGQEGPVQLGFAAASGQRLLQSGAGRAPIRVGEDYKPRKAPSEKVVGVHGAGGMRGLRDCGLGVLGQPDAGQVERMPSLFTEAYPAHLAGAQAYCGETAMHKSERCRVSELRGPRSEVLIPISDGGGALGHGEPRTAGASPGAGPNQQRRELRAGEPPLGNQEGELRESEGHEDSRLVTFGMAILLQSGDKTPESGDDTGADSGGRTEGIPGEAEELARDCRVVRVYDIINAGPRHRFTVSGVLVHNCGYQGGPGALKSMAPKWAETQTEEELRAIIDAWRAASPNIVRLWYDAERAAVEAIRTQGTVLLRHGVSFTYRSGHLIARLPSGRELFYREAKVELREKFGKERNSITYWGVDQKTKRWGKLETYGGKIAENLTQAIARDCLAVALARLDRKGFDCRFHVHDEVVAMGPESRLDEMGAIMAQPISWAPGLPLPADGFATSYYKKD